MSLLYIFGRNLNDSHYYYYYLQADIGSGKDVLSDLRLLYEDGHSSIAALREEIESRENEVAGLQGEVQTIRLDVEEKEELTARLMEERKTRDVQYTREMMEKEAELTDKQVLGKLIEYNI